MLRDTSAAEGLEWLLAEREGVSATFTESEQRQWVSSSGRSLCVAPMWGTAQDQFKNPTRTKRAWVIECDLQHPFDKRDDDSRWQQVANAPTQSQPSVLSDPSLSTFQATSCSHLPGLRRRSEIIASR